MSFRSQGLPLALVYFQQKFSMSNTLRASSLLLLLTLAGCGGNSTSRPENLLTSNDYEQLTGWVPDNTIPYLTKEKAHSGLYSACVNGSIEYASGFTSILGKLSTSRLSKIRIRAWVWLPSKDAKATLVTQLTDPTTGKLAFYDGLNLIEAADNKFNKWVEIEKTLTLPATASYTSVLQFYLWRAQSSQPVYLDDIQIERINDK